MSATEYAHYLRQEWQQFVAHPERLDAAAQIGAHISDIHRVLDVGCGAGQELLPYIHGALCIGVDVSSQGPPLARALLRSVEADARLAIGRARAEALPVRAGQIDLVICRLVLPYTHTPSAIAEVARVLRPGGGFSVQIHSPQYYVHKLRRAVTERDRRTFDYAVRVLRTGICFHLTGRHRAIFGTLESFLTGARLQRMAADVGLNLVAQLEGGHEDTPHLLFRRGQGG